MSATAAMETGDQGSGKVKDLTGRLKSFYVDVRAEMKKVTVPSWKDVQSTTIVVLVTVAVFGVFFFVTDYILTNVIRAIMDYFTH